jgi:hypothetical protein
MKINVLNRIKKAKLIWYDGIMLIFAIGVMYVVHGLTVNTVVDKWIEKADTISIYVEMKINGKPYLSERKLYDGKDYVLKVKNMFSRKLVYVDSAKWVNCTYGDRIIGEYVHIDRSYYRIYKQNYLWNYFYKTN